MAFRTPGHVVRTVNTKRPAGLFCSYLDAGGSSDGNRRSARPIPNDVPMRYGTDGPGHLIVGARLIWAGPEIEPIDQGVPRNVKGLTLYGRTLAR